MRTSNNIGIKNLCEVAHHILKKMPINAATKFAVRTIIREAVNKSNPGYKGNNNRKNCRYISSGAKSLTSNKKEDLVADHAVPISLLLEEIYKEKDSITLDQLVKLLEKYSAMTLITRNEDNLLIEKGLAKKMPIGWDGEDIFARYKEAGIEVEPNPSLRQPHPTPPEF